MATKYFLRNTNADTGCDAGAAIADHDLDQSQGTGPNTISSGSFTNTTWETKYTFDEDVSGDSPATGAHTVSIVLANMSKCDVRLQLEEISSGCSSTNSSGYGTTRTTNGTHSETLGSLTWSTGTRLRLTVQAQRTSGEHGNASFDISSEDTNSFVNATWTAGAALVKVDDNVENIDDDIPLRFMDLVRKQPTDSDESIVEVANRLKSIIKTEPGIFWRVNTPEMVNRVLGLIKHWTPGGFEGARITWTVNYLLSQVRVLDDNENIVEDINRLMDQVRVLDDNESIVEAVNIALDWVKTLDADENVVEAVNRLMDMVRVAPDVDENIVETSLKILASAGAILKVLDEVENLVEARNRLMAQTRVADADENVTEAASRLMAQARVADETQDIAETVLTPMQLRRILDADENIVETVLRIAGFSRISTVVENIGESILVPITINRAGSSDPANIQETAVQVLMLPTAEPIQFPPGALLPSVDPSPYNELVATAPSYVDPGGGQSPTYNPYGISGPTFTEFGTFTEPLIDTGFETESDVSEVFDIVKQGDITGQHGTILNPKGAKACRVHADTGFWPPEQFNPGWVGKRFEVSFPFKIVYSYYWVAIAGASGFVELRFELLSPGITSHLPAVDPHRIEYFTQKGTTYLLSEGEYVPDDTFNGLIGEYELRWTNVAASSSGRASNVYLDDMDIQIKAITKYSGTPV